MIKQPVRVPVDEYGAKFRDKPESYHFLAHENGIYLPHIDSVSWPFLRDIQSGKKKKIKGSDVKHLHVPQYEDLTIEEFLKFAGDYPFVTMCLPDRKQEL